MNLKKKKENFERLTIHIGGGKECQFGKKEIRD
jgi:hypothetical protein